jgi:hypothetical protein
MMIELIEGSKYSPKNSILKKEEFEKMLASKTLNK